jgi:hypothetical protein
LKVLDTPKLYNAPVQWNDKEIYPHGLAAVTMLATAAATHGKPQDIDALEKRLSATDLSTRVSFWYCWRNYLRTHWRHSLVFINHILPAEEAVDAFFYGTR